MNLLTQATNNRRSQLSFLTSFDRTGVLRALAFAMVLCRITGAQTHYGLVPTNPLANALAIKENFLTVEGLRVRYIESGSGPAIVMIHGNAGSADDFTFGAVDALATSYHVIAVDRPGHGLSDRPKGKTASLEYQARFLHDVHSLLAVTQPVLVGHSWGAALALCYALTDPEEISGLILVAPSAYPDSGESRLLRALTKPPLLGDAALIAGKSILGKQLLKSTLARAFYPQPLPHGYLELVAASWLRRKQLKAYLEDESGLNESLKKLSQSYSTIDLPVVIITGDQDQIVSAKDNAYRLQAAIPNSLLIALKGIGHEIPQSDPESIYTAVGLIRNPIGAAKVFERRAREQQAQAAQTVH